MNLRRTLLLAAALALPLSLATADTASAQCGLNGVGYGYGGYCDIGRLYRVLSQEVPYFAAFPPVYYSQPVPRTYGHSPFAYPPGHLTPEVSAPTPLAIDNPYFEGKQVELTEGGDAPVDQTTTIEPLSIDNPFVKATQKPVLQAAVLH